MPIVHHVDFLQVKSSGANNNKPTMLKTKISDNSIHKIKQSSFIYYFLKTFNNLSTPIANPIVTNFSEKQ